jgi:hypothetical protein
MAYGLLSDFPTYLRGSQAMRELPRHLDAKMSFAQNGGKREEEFKWLKKQL